jgi:hypothetical protein
MSLRTRKRPAHIRDLLDDDQQVICTESFTPGPAMHRQVQRGEYHRLDDPLVRGWPQFFAVVVPVNHVLGEIER